MARKSMKSRVPADVWAAMAAMRSGDESAVYGIGNGMQGAVYGIHGNDEWVIKRWFRHGEESQDDPGEYRYWEAHWQARQLAKDIARGVLVDQHLPNVIYAVGRYIVMERLAGTVDWGTVHKLVNARDLPARYLSRKWRRLRKAMHKLIRAGYNVNDLNDDNVMLRKDGTIVLNDVVA